MFYGLLSCLLMICSSKHIFWYQIYGCTTLRSRFMARKGSNLVIFVRKSDTEVIARLFSPLKHFLNHYVLLPSSSTHSGFILVPHSCLWMLALDSRNPENKLQNVKNRILGQNRLKRPLIDLKSGYLAI